MLSSLTCVWLGALCDLEAAARIAHGYREFFWHVIIVTVMLPLFHRKSPLYDNCFLHAPDGQPLCTCDRKKAQWYLDKGIGGKQSNFPVVI